MHQTTVRFGADLWEALEDECMRLGVSVAQYLREAALTRLTYAAGKRGDDDFEDALLLSTGGGRETRRTESGRDSAQVVPAARTARDAQERAWREQDSNLNDWAWTPPGSEEVIA